MTARSADGTEYTVPSVMGKIGDMLATCPGRIDQRITVTKNLSKSPLWLDSLRFDKDYVTEILDRPKWKIVRVEKLGKDRKILHFQPIMNKLAPIPEKIDGEKFAALVKEIGLTDEKLRTMLREMFLMLFRPKTLLRLEASDDLEFIMDDHWIYLRDGKTAYRV